MHTYILDVIPNIDEVSKLLIYKDNYVDTLNYIRDSIYPITNTIESKIDYRTYDTNIDNCNIKCINCVDVNRISQRDDIINEDEIKNIVGLITSYLAILSGVRCDNYVERKGYNCNYKNDYDDLVANMDLYRQIEQNYIFEGSFTNNIYKEYIRYCDIMILIFDYLFKAIEELVPTYDIFEIIPANDVNDLDECINVNISGSNRSDVAIECNL